MNVCEENSCPLECAYSPGPLFSGKGLKVEKYWRQKLKQKQMAAFPRLLGTDEIMLCISAEHESQWNLQTLIISQHS